jgi:hypothetical protein
VSYRDVEGIGHAVEVTANSCMSRCPPLLRGVGGGGYYTQKENGERN